MPSPSLPTRLLAEFIGTAMLLVSVVGSGIMAETLSGGNVGLALLANAIATGAMLYAIITTLGPVSGAHFNPAVTLAFALHRQHAKAQILPYIAIAGVWLTHLMFDLPILQLSTHPRASLGLWSSEVFATFGLLFVIFGGKAHAPDKTPTLVALYITGAYWFTSSTSFANPAVTIARGFSDSFAGIYPGDIAAFIAMQLLGTAVASLILPRLFVDKDNS